MLQVTVIQPDGTKRTAVTTKPSKRNTSISSIGILCKREVLISLAIKYWRSGDKSTGRQNTLNPVLIDDCSAVKQDTNKGRHRLNICPHVAEDMVQEALIKQQKAMMDRHIVIPIATYLKDCILDMQRSVARRMNGRSDVELSYEQEYKDSEQITIPEQSKIHKICILKQAGHTNREIGERLNISCSTVSAWISDLHKDSIDLSSSEGISITDALDSILA